MNDFTNDIENCLNVLHAGGTILYPTDTIWGIGCDATNAEAVEKIFQIKNRPIEKSFIVLVADERDILQYVAAPDLAVFDYLEKCEKPITVIYENGLGLTENIIAADGSIAIRVCKDEFCKHLIKRFRKPIVSTSANISSKPSAKKFKEIDDAIKNAVDYVVKYRQDDISEAQPSTIIKWKNGEVVVR